MPVKQNIPIWSVICCQLQVDPLFASPSLNCVLMVMILSAMVLTSTNHSALSSGLVITSAAILAPCLGGLLYRGLTMIFTWLSTLGQKDIMAFINEISDSESILINIPRCKSLIGHVEIRKKFSGFNNCRYLLPLFRRRIHSGWIVSTCMKKDDGSFRNG